VAIDVASGAVDAEEGERGDYLADVGVLLARVLVGKEVFEACLHAGDQAFHCRSRLHH